MNTFSVLAYAGNAAGVEAAVAHAVGMAIMSAVVLLVHWGLVDQLLTARYGRDRLRENARKAWALGFAAALRRLAAHPEVVEMLRADPVAGLNAIAGRAEQEGRD